MKLLPIVLAAALLVGGCRDDPLMHADDAPPGSIGNLAGSYVLNGIDPFGTEYAGRLDITRGAGTGSYRLQWIIPEAVQEGTGTLRGNTLQVDWQTSEESALTVTGTALFTVTVDGELYGAKKVAGNDSEWRETAYPIDASN